MQIDVNGKNITITDALEEYVNTKFSRLSRHYNHILDSNVILAVEKLNHIAEANIHISGTNIFAIAEAPTMYAAIDALTDKLDRQLIKHKDKHKDNRHHREH